MKITSSLRYKLLLAWVVSIVVTLGLVGGVFRYLHTNQQIEETLVKIENSFATLNAEIATRKMTLGKNTKIIANRQDIIATTNMVSTYQDIENYLPSIFDADKKRLALEMAKQVQAAGLDGLAVDDSYSRLIGFHITDKEKGSFTGYLSFEDGVPALYIDRNHDKGFRLEKAPPALLGIMEHTKKLEKLCIHVQNNPRALIMETHSPVVLRSPGEPDKTVGMVHATIALDAAFVVEMSRLTGLDMAIFLPDGSRLGQLEDVSLAKGLADIPNITDRQAAGKLFRDISNGDFVMGVAQLQTDSGQSAFVVFGQDKQFVTVGLTASEQAIYVVLLLTGLTFVPIAVLFLNRVVGRPIGKLMTGVENLRSDIYDEISGFTDSDELSALARSFNLMSREIREREKSLRESEHKLRSLFDNLQDIIYRTDTEGRIVMISPSVEDMFGYAPEELIGRKMSSFYVHTEERTRFIEELKQGSGNVRDFTSPLRHKDGHAVMVSTNAHFYTDENGQVLGVEGTSRDITDLKRAEELLIKHSNTLEETISERTSELELAKAKAEGANRAKSAFLANMSHEIRTPMNGVIGMVDMLMQKDLEPEDKHMVQTIRNSSFFLLRIIDDILDSSKIEAGKLELENTPVQLYPIIEGVTETILPTADAAGVRLTVFINPVLPGWIYSDATRLRQILMNLVSNAVKFSKPKNDGKQGHVDILAEASDGDHFRLTVTDNGIGMNEEALDKLFKPFSQAEEATTREFGGTGLGLMISKSLTEMMGGIITVDSTLGEGSSFSVTLPLKEAEETSYLPHVSEWTVLVLTNDPLFAARMTNYIGYHESHLRVAKNKDELMQWLAEEPEQVMVFLHCETPQEDGNVCEEIQSKFGQTRILSFTFKRHGKIGLITPNHYVIQRSPTLPSELYKGLAVLAGLIKPDVDVTALGFKPVSVEDGEAKNQKILLVEDNETNQDVIMLQLKMLGYAAEVAEDGQQGLELWKTGRFDLVLTDCHMPNMDGFQMTDAIRVAEKKSNLSHVPIIAITANALQGEAEHCLASGMDAYLSKPVELVRLRKALEEWLPTDSYTQKGPLWVRSRRNHQP